MPTLARRLDTNAPGDFYVDATCIDCGTCRWVAPATFDARAGYSRVFQQPEAEDDRHRARMALLACPTASIGTVARHDLGPARAAFPDRIHEEVYHCGYHAESSFGAASYLVVHAEGNVLVDSPRFTGPLVRRLEDLGGVATLFLTHRDDVADHQKFRDHFGCTRVLHRADVGRGTASVEVQPEGEEPVPIGTGLLVIPTPGHTRGSACLLVRDTFLFSGDHAAWSRPRGQVIAFDDACWYDWHIQRASMSRLLLHRFEWILPGHGRRCRFPAEQMSHELERCITWMGETAGPRHTP